MSKVIRTGTIYRMVGFMAAIVITLAIAVPMVAQSMIQAGAAQDIELAARPDANAPIATPVEAPKQPKAPRTPVAFGAPTMSAAPTNPAIGRVDQQKQNDASPTQTPNPSTPNPSNASPNQGSSDPTVPSSLSAIPAPGPKVGTVSGVSRYPTATRSSGSGRMVTVQ